MAKKDAASKRPAEGIARARVRDTGGSPASGSRTRLHATAALEECLLSIMNDEDNPELSVIDNKRRRYARTLWVLSRCFENFELKTYIATLGVKFEDLIRGVKDPLFVTKGRTRDSMHTWGGRLRAVLGLECWIKSGLSREAAANKAAEDYPALKKLMRGDPGAGYDDGTLYLRSLKGSLLSWYDYFVEGRVPVPELQEAFQETRCAIQAANFPKDKDPKEEYRKIGERYFEQAVKFSVV